MLNLRKSTVMALLERFYDPDAGTVLVNGQDTATQLGPGIRENRTLQ